MEVSKIERAEYLRTLRPLQNHPANCLQDHISFTGFFSRHAEFTRLIWQMEQRVKAYKPQGDDQVWSRWTR